jgi:hypothetical protein
MRTRPTRVGSSVRISSTRWMGAAIALASLIGVQPATAAPEVSTAERIASTGMDMLIVRPLAAVRTGIGSLLLVPAALLASPACIVNLVNDESCRPVYEAPYDVLVGDPAEYAFRRKMGEL